MCQKKFLQFFHNGSNYHYCFIIKELAEEFERQFNFLGKNTEKYITFSVPIETQVMTVEKNGVKFTETLSYRLHFFDSARFISSSLSILVDNLAEEIHKIKCTDCDICCLEYTNTKDDLIEYKCLCCNKITKKTSIKT